MIAHVRETTGLDQTDFGQMLGGWSRSQVARWEKGDSDPQVAFWINFTKATSLSLTWVFTGLGSPYEYLLQEYDDHHGFMRWVYVESERQLLSGGHPEPRTRRGVEYLQVRTKGDSETESGGEDTGELSGGVSRSPKAQKTKKPKRQ
ncbi:MAG: helix-turn-helix transcriptional regulator [Phycisphaerae bacterium]|nr:helix-turn-helix transcriptional regulator [Phycisphaerae bacterium]